MLLFELEQKEGEKKVRKTFIFFLPFVAASDLLVHQLCNNQ